MPSHHRVIINDEIELIDYQPAPAFRLPPPSNGSRPQADSIVIVISSDDESEAPATKRAKPTPHNGFGSSSAKRKHPGSQATAITKRRPLKIDLTGCDDIVEDLPVQHPHQSKPKPPQKTTKENPIHILDSDDEPMLIDDEPLPPPSPPPPVNDEQESDSDYENIHHGYVIGWSTSAADPDEHMFDVDIHGVEEAVTSLSLNEVKTDFISNSCRLAPVPPFEAAASSQQQQLAYHGTSALLPLPNSRHHGPSYMPYSGGRSRTGLLRHRQIPPPLKRLKLSAQFQMADACHSITQSAGKILFASSTPGGTSDDDLDDTFTVDPYNSRDTLATWSEDDKEQWLRAHFVNSNDPGMAGGRYQRKYYDINKAQFDPSDPSIFVSTGLDGTLAIWSSQPPMNKQDIFQDNDNARPCYVAVKKWGRETFGGNSCHDIVYRQQEMSSANSLFAAPCDNGAIFVHSYNSTCDSFTVHPLRVTRHAHLKAGATVWGQGSTSNALFVCSEAESDLDAFHGAFDFKTRQLLYRFDDYNTGEELALSPEGNDLALFTASEDGLRMRLYDVAHHNSHHWATVTLPSASPQLHVDVSPEVRSVSWSPDGIMLAVGGNDDTAHVYDVRCLGRGPLFSLAHETRSGCGLPLISLPPENHSETKSCFGITVLSWTLESSRSPSLALITGGGDHCITLWDVKTACKERQVLAELDGHVGVAHFGDLSKGEKPLVAGDTDGHIYIYDFVKRNGSFSG